MVPLQKLMRTIALTIAILQFLCSFQPGAQAFLFSHPSVQTHHPTPDEGFSSGHNASAYESMQKTLLRILDGVSGHDFVWNWINVLSPNVIVCYPFVGVIGPRHCLMNKSAVINNWGKGIGVLSTAIQQESFWLTTNSNTGDTLAVWKYTTSSAYVSPSNKTSCTVQFGGTVLWDLDPHNASLISKWLESPQTDRIKQTYPCNL